jgi:hypothetical protein
MVFEMLNRKLDGRSHVSRFGSGDDYFDVKPTALLKERSIIGSHHNQNVGHAAGRPRGKHVLDHRSLA